MTENIKKFELCIKFSEFELLMHLHGFIGVGGHDAGARYLVCRLNVVRGKLAVFLAIQMQDKAFLF